MDDFDYYVLALSLCPGIGLKTIQKLQQYFKNFEEIFKKTNTLKELGFSDTTINSIQEIDWQVVDKIVLWKSSGEDNNIFFYHNEEYPKILKEIYQAPIILYAIGNKDIVHNPGIAIVGSRKPTSEGRKHTWQWATELAMSGLNIISGMALGIDGTAHEAALSCKKHTIAVLGSGIERVYPTQHRKLYEIIKKNSLIISEFPLNTPPTPRQFPRRNRIISGLSLGVLVMEAAIKSGSLNTARWALEQNRAIMAVPGGINSNLSAGCNYLIQQGARLVTSTAEILDEINYHPESDNNKDCDILSLIKKGVNTLEEISTNLSINIEDAVASILELELSGKITSVSGFYKCL